VPLSISYCVGALTKHYVPDFVVIDDDDVHWIIEGKSDSETSSPTALLKRDAAQEWVSTVNGAAVVSQRWAYLLASESLVTASTSWAALKTAAQTFTQRLRKPITSIRPPFSK
jgi:type III restriction enzyme